MAILEAAGAFMLAVKIPQDFAWHSIAVEASLDFLICLEAVLLVRNKVGTCLAVLIGFGQVGWLAYKRYTHGGKKATGAVMDGGDFEQQGVQEGSELVMMEEGGNKTPLVLTGEAEVSAGAAMGSGDDVQQQNMEEGVEVEERQL